jgi:hypothetical protein
MRPEQERELLRTLGVLGEEEPAEPEQREDPDFDGGARMTPPLPSNPALEHDQTVLEIAQRAKWGGQW